MAIGGKETWRGPWCSCLGQDPEDPDGPGVCSYARHVWEDGVFRTELVNAEKLWEMGLGLKNLPGPGMAIIWEEG